eukprot:5876632-Prymnesium_polylepis.1
MAELVAMCMSPRSTLHRAVCVVSGNTRRAEKCKVRKNAWSGLTCALPAACVPVAERASVAARHAVPAARALLLGPSAFQSSHATMGKACRAIGCSVRALDQHGRSTPESRRSRDASTQQHQLLSTTR